MSKTLILLLSLLFLLIPSTLSTIGLDTLLSDHFRLDSHATNDTFLSLPSSLKSSLPTLPLLPLTLPVPVHVRLVGPFSPIAPSLLSSFVSAAHSSASFHLLSNPDSLVVSHSLHLHPTLTPPSLASKISSSIASSIASSAAPFHRSSLFPVHFSVVDDLVKEDFLRENSHSSPGFYVYLLNLGPQAKPYGYAYDRADAAGSSPSFSKCFGSLWTGSERYLWIDLSAGPVDYGPALSGEGLLPRGEFHPLAAFHAGPRSERALLVDLSSLVLSAYRSLLVPPLRVPVFHDSEVLVRFFHVHGQGNPDLVGLNWHNIERTIRDAGLLLRDQHLRFQTVDVKFSDCALCSFAISKSTNSYTSRFLFENYTLIVSEYLDSKQLHHILSDSAEGIHKLAGIGEDEYSRVVPVYVFDLDFDRLLMLDRYHQSVAFRNMVIAVRTRTSQTVSDYSCNGRHVITQTRELERSIVGSLLQTVWGVSPTHMTWSPQRNDTLVDYTWSVGQTPFGPFSTSSSLSFAQKDAAKRNAFLTILNYTITSVIDIRSNMAAHGGDRKVLKGNKHVEFVQRLNLLKYKIDKGLSAISHFDFDKAMYFLRSSDHDLYAIHSLVYEASQELEASLVCFQDPPFPWSSISVSVGLLGAFIYIYVKRDKLFTNKTKKF